MFIYTEFPYDEEVTTTTVTTTTTETVIDRDSMPPLLRSFDEAVSAFFVIDPVDKDKVYLHATDDIYEDGAGNWYKLV